MRIPILAILAACAAAAPLHAGEKPSSTALAGRIDYHVNAKLRQAKVSPAPLADDAAYHRRAFLLLVGRIPMPSEIYAFLEDKDPRKREKLVERLLAAPGHANHFAAVWRGWLVPEALTRFEVAASVTGFESWLRDKFATGTAYDKLVSELLTTPVAPTANPQSFSGFYDPFNGGQSPLLFYYAKDAKPENLTGATARLFLGVQLECAQCHDHPFAKWSRDQFWGLAGFFGGIEKSQPDVEYGALREVFDRRELSIPNTDRVIQASFPDGREPVWKPRTGSRVTLAEWVTAKDNPYFARATVNRVWAYMFGTGLVEPVDDFTDENQPSHPELMAELTQGFLDSNFDLNFLLRAILQSETFARSSAQTDAGQVDPRLFARYAVQSMTPEQLFDSLSLVAAAGQSPPGGLYLTDPGSPKRQFLDKFALAGNRTEAPTSILQALTLMNGDMVSLATDPDKSRPVQVATSLPGLTDEERIEILYLTALGRKPRAAELERALKHVRTDPKNPKKKYGDVLWALLNSAEFRTNH